MLTGKVKENFEKWLDNQNIAPYKVMFWDIPKIVQYAYIIEYFDSIGWVIDIKSKFGQRKQCERFMFHIKNYKSQFLFNSRMEVKEQAIIKTDELLNAKLLRAVC